MSLPSGEDAARESQPAHDYHYYSNRLDTALAYRLIGEAQEGSDQAMAEICIRALPFVRNIVGQVHNPGERDEQIQQGFRVVPAAVERYHLSARYTTKFPVYLHTRVRGSLIDLARFNLPITRQGYDRLKAIAKDSDQIDPSAALHELAKEGRLEEAGAEIEGGKIVNIDPRISMNSPIRSSSDTGIPVTVEATLVSKDDVPDIAFWRQELGSTVSSIQAALYDLTERERLVVTHINGLFGNSPKKLAEIGAMIGVSESRVSQISSEARRKIVAHVCA